uniref:DNA-3-methyladenine glycosylase n=1 Tax=Oryctolagus cuniculus TaxID=9986 RepID=A0A5F9DFR9_RABIT
GPAARNCQHWPVRLAPQPCPEAGTRPGEGCTSDQRKASLLGHSGSLPEPSQPPAPVGSAAASVAAANPVPRLTGGVPKSTLSTSLPQRGDRVSSPATPDSCAWTLKDPRRLAPGQLSQKIGHKKQRLAEADLQRSPLDAAPIPGPEEPRLGRPASLGPQRSVYFSRLKDRPARLGSEFFNQPAVPLAQAFLGQVLVRRLADGTELRGRIVETEAYVGPEDEAAHSRGGRQTARNRAMFMKPGTLYVYLIYGMYFCMNVSSQGDGACVLLRALEPLGGLETMRQLRSTVRKGTASRTLKDRELCSGPSKLCQALAIDKSFDQRDLAQDEALWLEHGPPGPSASAVVAAARVGIGHTGEWAQKPLRFYVRGSPWVSVVDRVAEQNMQV